MHGEKREVQSLKRHKLLEDLGVDGRIIFE
jgi:hypothetical protein